MKNKPTGVSSFENKTSNTSIKIIDYKKMIAEKQSDIQNKISELWGEIQKEEA